MNTDIFRNYELKDDNNKDETDDVHSESSDEITHTDQEKLNLTTEDFDSKIHFRVRSVLEGITPKQQKEIAADMFSQMKQLKAHNEILGYHEFSGLLKRHDSNMNITGKKDIIMNPHSETNTTHNVDSERGTDIARNSLCETQPLRDKLGSISMSINKIQQELATDNENNANNIFDNISAKQVTDTILFFQNQLTQIQDQIEDAENYIDANIDYKFLKYIQQINLNKEKIKNMKTESKKRRLQISKEKEQNNIIGLQRLQIDQLILAQSLQSPLSHSDHYNNYNINEMYYDDGTTPTSINLQKQKRKPLLNDKAFKIVGGVVIVVFGIWIISKYIGGNTIFSARKRLKY